jgi:hypothetical protein
MINFNRNPNKFNKFILSAFSAAVLMFITAYLSTLIFPITIKTLVDNPIGAFNAPIYYGTILKFGIILWISTSAICLFTFFIIRNELPLKKISFSLLFSSILSLIFALDELFLTHVKLFPLFMYIDKNLVFVIYIVLFLLLLIYSRRVLFRYGYFLFVLAIIFFLGKVGMDWLRHWNYLPDDKYIFIEDGFKFFGILAWFLFYSKYCYLQIKKGMVS